MNVQKIKFTNNLEWLYNVLKICQVSISEEYESPYDVQRTTQKIKIIVVMFDRRIISADNTKLLKFWLYE